MCPFEDVKRSMPFIILFHMYTRQSSSTGLLSVCQLEDSEADGVMKLSTLAHQSVPFSSRVFELSV